MIDKIKENWEKILLILKEEKDGVLVENRINHSFMQKQKNEKKKYHVNCLFTEI